MQKSDHNSYDYTKKSHSMLTLIPHLSLYDFEHFSMLVATLLSATFINALFCH